jgi:hypothetical protein
MVFCSRHGVLLAAWCFTCGMVFYLWHGSAVPHMHLMAPPSGANHVNISSAVGNANGLHAPGIRQVVNSNVRCVLRSNQLCLNRTSSMASLLDLNRNTFGPRHTPYFAWLRHLGPIMSTFLQRWVTRTAFTRRVHGRWLTQTHGVFCGPISYV